MLESSKQELVDKLKVVLKSLEEKLGKGCELSGRGLKGLPASLATSARSTWAGRWS